MELFSGAKRERPLQLFFRWKQNSYENN